MRLNISDLSRTFTKNYQNNKASACIGIKSYQMDQKKDFEIFSIPLSCGDTKKFTKQKTMLGILLLANCLINFPKIGFAIASTYLTTFWLLKFCLCVRNFPQIPLSNTNFHMLLVLVQLWPFEKFLIRLKRATSIGNKAMNTLSRNNSVVVENLTFNFMLRQIKFPFISYIQCIFYIFMGPF